MPKHRVLLGKLLHTAEILLTDAEQILQSAQVDDANERECRHHHLMAKNNVLRIHRLLSVDDSAWMAGTQVGA